MRFHGTALAAALCLASGCSRPAPPPSELAATATIKDLMDAMVNPNAEYLFDNIVVITDESGVIDKTPKTDEEWAEVRRRAVLLVEAPNLLVAEGRKVARPGQKAEYPDDLVFATVTGNPISPNNVLRRWVFACERLKLCGPTSTASRARWSPS